MVNVKARIMDTFRRDTQCCDQRHIDLIASK